MPPTLGRTRICMVPHLSGVGGMVSFQDKLAAGLAKRGIQVTHDLRDHPFSAVLVIGGTRHLGLLWRARQRGIPIIQRLDGMNWVHRLRPTGIRHYLRAEYGNILLNAIRTRLANRVVYQSRFARRWWERVRGPTRVPNTVIYNGVDLSTYTPAGPERPPDDRYRLLLVEGSLMGGYEMGLEFALGLAEGLSREVTLPLELLVVGRIDPSLQERWERQSQTAVRWTGLVPPRDIPAIDRSAHVLFSADLNAACPNAAIEALACGLPVAAFDTGSLPELVAGDAGRVVPYGGDPWQIDPPDMPALVRATHELLADQRRFRAGARARAEAVFGLDSMVAAYLSFILDPATGLQP